MIYVLFALLAGLAWALWFILYPTIWWLVPAIVTGVLVLVAVGWFVFRLLSERRAAAALESAIAEQGRQQAMNVGVDRRGEIDALQKQIGDGIAALKASKLGGKRRGGSALYALPWYAIVGPPGAGKTTALKHSGLVFPYADTSIRGVGGTRNCDWWFTNEAILLDTAGRYATEHADQQEWFAFLDMLRKYRGDKPLNGLIVAVSVPDVLDANDAQLEEMGKKLRARIDEVMTRLRMVLPVYFLVTKCDLVAGFTEFFGDLRKSERAQAWGATVMLGEDKSNPGALFDREFDVLVARAHGRAIKRLAYERDRSAREAIYQFPLELAGLKRNLRDLLGQVFMVNAFQGTPTLRGVYFTSGTQEGTPLNRVLERMGQAMGIQSAGYRQAPKVESKSYFLHDVFTKVVFPDADVAARSQSELRRQKLTRVAVSVTALAVAVMFAVPSIVSFSKNRAMLREAEARAKVARDIDWESPTPIKGKLAKLDPLLQQLKELEDWEENGAPLDRRFLMYSGDKVYKPLVTVYVANMQKGFVTPCKFYLEKELNRIAGKDYAKERLMLKTYLMLGDVEHLDVEWATGRFTALWAQLQQATSDISISQLKERLRPHVHLYFQLIKPPSEGKARARPVDAHPKVVAHARQVLQSVPVRQRYYAMFVESVEGELYEPMDDPIGQNLKYPPLTLDAMFPDRPDVLKKWLLSKQKENKVPGKRGYFEITGPYTEKGHVAVLANITDAGQLLEREQWVVPLTAEERGDRVVANVALLAGDYEQKYISAWQGFLMDLDIKAPANLPEAIQLYKDLGAIPWPYARILRRLHDNVMWGKKKLSEGASKIANQKLKSKLTSKTGLRFNVDVNKIAGKASKIPPAFAKTVSFAVPVDDSKTPLNETPLASYIQLLDKLRLRMLEATRENPDANVNVVVLDLQSAIKETEAMVKPLDPMAQQILLPLLQNPLNVGGRLRLTNPGFIGR